MATIPSNTAIRGASIDDLDECFRVQKEADLAAFPHIYPPEQYPFPDGPVREAWASKLTDDERSSWMAEVGGRVVGCACVHGDQFDSIAVVPEMWGTAIANLLYETAVQHAARAGITSLHLWVLAENGRARHFYEGRGWRLDGRTKDAPFPPYPELLGYTLDQIGRS